MQRFIKIFTVMILILILIPAFSGCSSKKSDGIYTLGSIDEGYYIKSGEDFYPLIEDSNKKKSKTSSDTVSSNIAEESISVIWISENREKIPVYGQECELVYFSENAIPDIIPLYCLTDYGVTLGIKLARTYDGNVLGLTSNVENRFCKGSDAERIFDDQSIDTYDTVRIVNIGGSMASNEILSEVYTVKDLTDGADYDITYYVGTKFETVTITADTHVFSATKSGIKSLSNLSYTKKGYVIINFPENMEEGYYYIDHGGVFYFAPERSGGFITMERE